VIAAVRTFERDHGRLPRALEFFRWRYEGAVDAPTQATVYKLFPGGWTEVLRALGRPSAADDPLLSTSNLYRIEGSHEALTLAA
jgi:hypothetical protein